MAIRLPPGIQSREHTPRGASRPRTQYRAFVSDSMRKTSSGRSARVSSPWLDTLAEARAWKEEVEHERRSRGRLSADRQITVLKACDVWLSASQKVGMHGRRPIRESTGRRYKITIENLIKPTIGLLKVAELSAGDIRRWVNDQVAEKTRDEVGRGLDIVRQAFDYQVELDAIAANPASSIKLAKRDDDSEQGVVTAFMEPAAVKLMRQVADAFARQGYQGDRAALSKHTTNGTLAARAKAWAKYRPMFYLLITAGIRIGELCALQWKDVDFEGGTIRIEKTINDKGVIGPPKTRTSIRTITMSGKPMEILKGWYDACPDRSPSTYVFGGDKPAIRSNLSARMWKPLMVAAGLVDEEGSSLWSFHDCRHWHASVLINNGMDPQQVCNRLGHANVTTTLRIYTHLFKEQKAKGNTRAVELEDKVLAM